MEPTIHMNCFTDKVIRLVEKSDDFTFHLEGEFVGLGIIKFQKAFLQCGIMLTNCRLEVVLCTIMTAVTMESTKIVYSCNNLTNPARLVVSKRSNGWDTDLLNLIKSGPSTKQLFVEGKSPQLGHIPCEKGQLESGCN